MQNAKRKTQNAKWRWRLGNIVLAVIVLLMSVVAACADDDDDDDDPQLTPGVVGHYDGGGAACVRRDAGVQFIWGDRAPDERLPPGEFSARWQGQLYVVSPGKHRFYLYAAGDVVLQVAGKKLIAGQSDTPRWFDSAVIELDFGHQPLTIEFKKTSAAARVGLYWSGPQFELEPVPGRLLFHDPADDPGDAFEHGAELWRALRCGNCHNQTGVNRPHPNPLPKGEGTKNLPLPPGEGRREGAPPHKQAPNSNSDNQADTNRPHPNPLPKGEGTKNLPLPPGEGRGEGAPPHKQAPNSNSDNQADTNRPHPNPLPKGEGTTPPTAAPALRAPSLAKLSGNLSRDWLIAWLANDAKPTPSRRMPHLGVTTAEAAAIADDLLADAAADTPVSAAKGDANRGRQLFITLGCLACHQLGDLGAAGLFGGGDLSDVANKRPPDFLARWLRDPASINADHRMPVFRLSDGERDDVAAWLATLRSSPPAPSQVVGKNLAAKGKQLVASLRCGNCHALPDESQATQASPDLAKLLAQSKARDDWSDTCLGSADRDKSRPGYNLPTARRDALIAYLSHKQSVPLSDAPSPQPSPGGRGSNAPSPQPPLGGRGSDVDGRFVLRERNCLACHARDTTEGIAPTLAALVQEGDSDDAQATRLRGAAAEMNLASLLPLLAPPALTGVGDKLLDAALADAITLRHPPLRRWLAIRMPRFHLSTDELAALTDHLATIDRIPDRPRVERPLNPKSLAQAGARLVTSKGFGCTSCHQIGHSLPTNVALAAHGSDLSLLGRRVRRPWFDRWVHNPARIVPRMEMPAIQMPVRGVLADKLDNQLAAVWQVLNTPGFEPPPTGPIRLARHPGDDSPPVVVTDVVELDRQVLLRPVMIGLSNRHNLLFDLSGNRLAGWWLGDTANQLTVGKSWHWEPAGFNLLVKPAGRPEVELLAGERALSPGMLAGTSLSELDWLETKGESAAFGYRLQFIDDGKPIVVQVTQEVAPLDSSPHAPREDSHHAERDADASRPDPNPLPEGEGTKNLPLPPGEGRGEGTSSGKTTLNSENQVNSDTSRPHPNPLPEGEGTVTGFRRSWTFRVPLGYTVRLRDLPADAKMKSRREQGETIWQCEAVYTTPEQPPAARPIPELPAEPPAALSVVPGYEAVRLPLVRGEMPTGLAWRDDGTLAFCSLKGGVWLASDTDGDSLEDRLSLVADGLPAPYGIACQGDAIDVAAKFGLVRFSQLDDSGRALRADVIASGWGYAADYHDWTIGLPRDASGNYYVGLPCQQDNRSPADARWRGTVLKLKPRPPTSASPRRFEPEVLSAGHRFPTGLALDRQGELFVTDNQGNYNPFNELNHVRHGARYGFINKLDAKPGFQPPFEDPAVSIPHPWTRSVNGICFLNSPASRAGGFGPFEGHLIGCEFDTRRLIRLSLERIGDVYQGAAYPFSVEPTAEEPTFEGPVVCAVSPRGELYVGNLRDSGWGGGQNTGSIVRLRPSGALPVGIAEVRARPDGFSIAFTGPVDAARAGDTANYTVASYRRVVTPAYGGPDVDREQEAIQRVEVSADGRRARLRLKRMRAGFVYELQLKNLAPRGAEFFPAEAYYSLRRIPTEG